MSQNSIQTSNQLSLIPRPTPYFLYRKHQEITLHIHAECITVEIYLDNSTGADVDESSPRDSESCICQTLDTHLHLFSGLKHNTAGNNKQLKGFKKVKAVYSTSWEPISELRGVTCHTGSHSVTCHPTQVNAPRLNCSQTGRYSIYLPRTDGRLS